MNVRPNESDTVSIAHEALACVYRRRIVEYLIVAADNVVTVAELRTALLDHDQINGNQKHINLKLHHSALPKLSTLGFIEYDDKNQTVRYRDSPVLEQFVRLSADATNAK